MGYYQDLYDDYYADFEAERSERQFRAEKVSTREYSIAKGAKVGTRIVCAGCGKAFLKRSYQPALTPQPKGQSHG